MQAAHYCCNRDTRITPIFTAIQNGPSREQTHRPQDLCRQPSFPQSRGQYNQVLHFLSTMWSTLVDEMCVSIGMTTGNGLAAEASC